MRVRSHVYAAAQARRSTVCWDFIQKAFAGPGKEINHGGFEEYACQ